VVGAGVAAAGDAGSAEGAGVCLGAFLEPGHEAGGAEDVRARGKFGDVGVGIEGGCADWTGGEGGVGRNRGCFEAARGACEEV